MKPYRLAIIAATLFCCQQIGAWEFPPVSARCPEHKQSIKALSGVPSGEANYDKKSAGTWVFGSSLALYEDNFPATIVWGEDGKVGFPNLFSTFPLESYAEGTFDGTLITLETGQEVAVEESADYTYNLGVFRTVYEDDNRIRFELDEDIETITFSVSDDGSLKLNLPGEPFDGENPSEYSIGMYFSDNMEFSGYCDFMQEYKKLDLDLIRIPEGAEVQQYVFVDQFSFASIVDVAFYEGYLYIRGLNGMLPEATLKAKIDGNKAVIAQNEYLGVYYDQFYIFTKVLLDNPDYDEEDEDSDPYMMAPDDVGFELNIDSDRRRIYADKEGIYLSFHCDGSDFLNSLGYYGIFELRYQETFAGTPSNPSDLEFSEEWVDMQGWADFEVNPKVWTINFRVH